MMALALHAIAVLFFILCTSSEDIISLSTRDEIDTSGMTSIMMKYKDDDRPTTTEDWTTSAEETLTLDKTQKAVQFPKDFQNCILATLDQCVRTITICEKYAFLSTVKKGKVLKSQNFKYFVFCGFTKSGFADEKTGLIDKDAYQSIYPAHCKISQVLKECEKDISPCASPLDKLTDTFECFLKNSACLPDFVPEMGSDFNCTCID